MNDHTVYMTLVSTSRQRSATQLLIDSIRTFAGHMGHYPIWLFVAGAQQLELGELEDREVEIIPLTIPDSIKQNPFAAKVCACSRAEELAGTHVQSLIWMSSDCLVLQPPVLFELGLFYDAAFRPVHIRNIGLLDSDLLDEFWKRIYQAVGVDDIQITVESFVDSLRLRAYYNSHAFAINPSKGLMRQWYEVFEELVCNQDFQSGACRDDLHQIFLHQAVLSTLVASRLDAERVCQLPPIYNYPYNLQDQVPVDKRSSVLNDLVCIAYEERVLNPEEVKDIHIDEPLRSWLCKKLE